MVSHVSDGAVAALGVANLFIFLSLTCFNFISIGASVVVTHHVGAGDLKGAQKIVATAISVNTWIGLIVSLIAFVFAEPLLRLMQLPPDLMVYARPFLSLMGGSIFMEAMNGAIGASLRAHGYTRDAMVVTMLQNVLNVIGNCVLLFGLFGAPKMGVTGVALSSVFSRVMASLALWILLERRLKLRLHVRDFFDFQLDRIKRILHIGLPAAGEHLSYCFMMMMITSFVARGGVTSLAQLVYTQQMQRFIMLFSFSVGLGTEILVGRFIGSGDFEAAYHEVMKSLRTGFIITTSAVVTVAIFAPQLLGLFSHDAAVIAGASLLLRLCVIYEPGRVFNIIVINALRATGNARFPVQVALVSQWLFVVPMAWFLGLKLGWGLPGIWAALMTEEWVRGMIMFRRWTQRRWLKYAHRSRAQVSNALIPVVPEP